jgi:hypothetical protein
MATPDRRHHLDILLAHPDPFDGRTADQPDLFA